MSVRVGPWTMTDDGCGAYRALAGKDGNYIPNRVAFVEKTPRVRIRDAMFATGQHRADPVTGFNIYDGVNWAQAPFRGDGPDDEECREWCDKMLALLGYEVEDSV